MALSDRVLERYGSTSEFLRQLTNPNDKDAATVDTTILGYATADAEGDFPTYAGADYDETIARHVSAGILGTIAYLKSYSTSQKSADANLAKFHDRLRDIRKVGAGKRVAWTTDSPLTPTARTSVDGTIRPDFDRPVFDDIAVERPQTGSGS